MPKTVKKGEDEYVIVVQGVQDTGRLIDNLFIYKSIFSSILIYVFVIHLYVQLQLPTI